MREMAAITSLEHRRLHIRRHSGEVSSSGDHSPFTLSYCCIKSIFFRPIVNIEKQKKATNVPRIPNNRMFEMLAKKFPLYMLKPDANTIGGKHIKKNVLSSNLRSSIKSSLSFI